MKKLRMWEVTLRSSHSFADPIAADKLNVVAENIDGAMRKARRVQRQNARKRHSQVYRVVTSAKLCIHED